MHIIHCIARAKLLDLVDDKIVKADVYQRGNKSKEVRLPESLYNLVLKRMNKNRKQSRDIFLSMDYGSKYTGTTFSWFIGQRVHKPKIEKPNPYKGWQYLEFTYAQGIDEDEDLAESLPTGLTVGAISLTSKLDKFTKRFGSMIACGRVAAGIEYLRKVKKTHKDRTVVPKHKHMSTFADIVDEF
jgi:hypothetical protein